MSASAGSSKFFNLTAQQVRIDSMLPSFAYTMPLPAQYQDSVYSVKLLYPEYIDLTTAEARRFEKLGGSRQQQVELSQQVLFDRGNPSLQVAF